MSEQLHEEIYEQSLDTNTKGELNDSTDDEQETDNGMDEEYFEDEAVVVEDEENQVLEEVEVDTEKDEIKEIGNKGKVEDTDKVEKKLKATLLVEHNGIRLFKSGIGYLVRSTTAEGETKTKQLTNFMLNPTLLVNDKTKKEEYVVDVAYNGNVYRNRRIQLQDINSPNRLKESLGIMGLVITGTAQEYAIFQMALRKEVRKTIISSEVLGMHDDGFLVPDGLITADGIVKDRMILLDKVGDAHTDTYDITLAEEDEWKTVTRNFMSKVTEVNNQTKMLVLLGWFLASILKEYLFREHNIKYPILQVYGTKGSGKTSTITTLLNFFGHADPKGAPTDRAFPIFKRLAMTNALAVYLDEYRESLANSADIKRIVRNSYDRRDDSRGQSSQELIKYDLLAPMIIVGEDPMMDAACQERTISVALRRREQHTDAFIKLIQINDKKLFLGGYMLWLIKHRDKWLKLLGEAENIVKGIKGFSSDRLEKSATCISFGLLLGLELTKTVNIEAKYDGNDIHSALESMTKGTENIFGDLAVEMMANVRDQYNKIFKKDEYLVQIKNNGRMIGYFKQHPLVKSVTGINKDSISTRSLVNKLHEMVEEDGFVKRVNYLKSIHGNTMRVLEVDLTQLCEEYPEEFEEQDFSSLLDDTDGDLF